MNILDCCDYLSSCDIYFIIVVDFFHIVIKTRACLCSFKGFNVNIYSCDFVCEIQKTISYLNEFDKTKASEQRNSHNMANDCFPLFR